MSAGDRYKNGKSKDIVRHYGQQPKAECGRKNPGYVSWDKSDVTCLKCLDVLVKVQLIHNIDGAAMAQAYHNPKIN